MWQYTPYNLLLGVATLLSLVVCAYVWPRRASRGGRPLCALMLGVSLWSLGAALEVAAVSLDAKLLFTKVLYLGVVLVPASLLLFVLEFSGRSVRWRDYSWLLVEPIAALAMVWYDPLHPFYWQSIDRIESAGFVVFAMRSGTGFWIHVLYSYVLMAASLFIMARTYRSSAGSYRKQAGVSIVALSIPWVSNAFYLSPFNPLPFVDLTPLSFVSTGALFSWSLLRFRVFDLTPIARDLLIDNMSYGILVFDDEKRVVDANPASGHILGRDDALIGCSLDQVASEVSAWLDGQDLQSGDKKRVELTLGASGHPCEVTLFSLHGDSGEQRGSMVMLQDISERKNKERLDGLVRSMRERVWSMERSQDIDESLQFACFSLQSLGVPVAYCTLNVFAKNAAPLIDVLHALNANSKGLFAQIRSEEEDSVRADLWRSGKSYYRPDLRADDPLGERQMLAEQCGEEIRSVIDMPFSHGMLTMCSTQEDAFPDRVAETVQLMVGLLSESFHRLDDIRASELHLQELSREVEEHRRTEEQLRVARDRAESASEVKSAFLANMSHEIRTPMSAVLGMTEILLDTELKESQRTQLRVIYNSADSLLKLLNDVLDFSRAERKALELEYAPFSLRECVRFAVETVQNLAEVKALQLNWSVDAAVADCYAGDVGRMRQVLINLLGNAIKFTRAGSVRVEVDLAASSAEGDLLRIAVADTGIGIAEDAQSRIFDVFTQADPSTTREFGGTGLGLSICRQIAGLMNGEIWVESEVGVGSTFFFTAALDREDAAHRRLDKDKSDSHSDLPKKSCRVLLVEDTLINQKIVQTILDKRGHEVVVANSGLAALEILDEDRAFDMVLMDLQMPEMGGIETTQLIRQRERAQQVAPLKIAALTGNVTDEARQASQDVGMNYFLTKPFRRNELLKLVEGS